MRKQNPSICYPIWEDLHRLNAFSCYFTNNIEGLASTASFFCVRLGGRHRGKGFQASPIGQNSACAWYIAIYHKTKTVHGEGIDAKRREKRKNGGGRRDVT
eukprot:GEMP01147656.1.p1 GENE.GEMP01147656.1~~GEMP01147656.1.p1  ORF type:complete len:101 (-),score=10.72 GEMP01147656.1:83-385(-)